MVKSLKYWRDRKTTLQEGDKFYKGTVIVEDFFDISPRTGEKFDRRGYFFETNNGRYIKISAGTVKSDGNGGLVLKLAA